MAPVVLPSRHRSTALILAVLSRRRALRRHDDWSRERLLAHQGAQLARRRHAYARSPYCSRHHAGLLDAPLAELPVLTNAPPMASCELPARPDVRLAPIEAYLSGGGGRLFRDRYYVAATAGTIGRRGVLAWDFAEWVQIVASYNRAFDWAGWTAGLTRQVTSAVVSSANPTHQSALVGASVHSHWVPMLRLDAGDDLAQIVERLNDWRPQMLIGTYTPTP